MFSRLNHFWRYQGRRQKSLSPLKNERGVAMVISLLVVTVITIFGSIFVLRTVGDKMTADKDRASTQAFYLSDSGGEQGLNEIDILINTDMMATINATNPQTVGKDAASYVASNDSIGFLVKYVKESNVAQLTQSGATATYTAATTTFGSGTYQYNIIITQKGNPTTVESNTWDFPFYYTIQSTGTQDGSARKIAFTGDFTVRVQKDNFAKYALFTDHHKPPTGNDTIWFDNSTNFTGPIHTNDNFNFANNPSGTFDGAVSQHQQNARFYNDGSPILMDADSNPPYDVPIFTASYTRGADEIVLSSSVKKQDLIDQARGGDNTSGNGIFVANNGTSLTGGIYVKGDAAITMSVDGNSNAVYAITQGSTTKNITANIPNNTTTVQTVGGGTSTYAGLPDGVDNVGTIVYVNGSITSVRGTIQKDTQLTVSSESGATITDDILYSEYTPGAGTPGQPGYVPPTAEGTTNLFGLLTWGGNIAIGTSAPDDINIHGVMMAQNTGSNAVFTVTDYSSGSPRGTVTLLGGAITQFYGAFGTFDGETGELKTGYGRNFVYDDRMMMGEAPPYFPSMKTFVAFTNDITDKIAWQEGGF